MTAFKPTVIDLFSGVGGLSLGAARAGFQVTLAVDLDNHAVAAHTLNFPNSRHWNTDISQLSGHHLLQYLGINSIALDGLIGGPPCQGFSMIGKRSVSDARNNLFVKFFELAGQCHPKFFLVENVPGILDKKYDSIRKKALEFVIKEYTIIGPLILKASDYGAPTTRERVFFVGYLPEAFDILTFMDFESKKIGKPTTVSEALYGLPAIRSDWIKDEQSWRKIKDLPDTFYGSSISGQIPEGVGDKETIRIYREQKIVSGNFGTRHTEEVKSRYANLKPGEQDKVSKSVRLELAGFCPTLRAGTDSDHGSYQAVRPIHPTMPRVITPREAARLQGFPDWFRFDPTKWHSFRLIGNSVSPILSQSILEVIFSHIKGVSNGQEV